MKKRFAVIGNPISHSLSPLIHQQFADQLGIDLVYETIQASDDSFEKEVKAFFDQGGIGLNVTLPFKERAFHLLEKASLRCQQAKAANTLWRQDGQLQGDNTDGIGLIRDLSQFLSLPNKQVLIVGAGGAARGIIGPLLAANVAGLTLVNRTLERAFALAVDFPGVEILPLSTPHNCLPREGGDPSIKIAPCDIRHGSPPSRGRQLRASQGRQWGDRSFDLVINATSAGLTDPTFFLPATLLKPTTFCYDLMYNRTTKTPFVQWAHTHHCEAIDGLGMLIEQAAEAFFIWHQSRPEIQKIHNVKFST